MPQHTPLTAEARAAGHQLYQALYAAIGEGIKLTTAQAQAEINHLVSPTVSAEELIRAARMEANYRYHEAHDDESAQTAADATSEPSSRMDANADMVNLLDEVQIEWQTAQIARWEAEDALWGLP